MKVHPIPHAIFETARSRFVQILHHCSVSSKIFAKEPTKVQNFRLVDCSGGISPNLYFDRLLLLKLCKVSAKKYGGVLCHHTKEWCKI